MQLAAQGQSVDKISLAMERRPESVRKVAMRLDVSLKKTK
jgi:hypothetical protein